jgi:hypothetical protein
MKAYFHPAIGYEVKRVGTQVFSPRQKKVRNYNKESDQNEVIAASLDQY